MHLRTILSSLFLLALPATAVPPPGLLNVQGRIAVGGTNYGSPAPQTGHFKFSLIDDGAAETFWTNDGTNAGTPGGEPTAAVPVTVTNGHYSLALGNPALANMTGAVPASLFEANDEIYLRTWFGTDAGGPFEQLTPDRRITSNPYALHAAKAGGVSDGAITAAMLAAGSITSDKLAADAVTAASLAPGAAAANIEEDGTLGIGLGGSEPSATLQLDGDVGFLDPALLAELVDGAGGFNRLAGARSVHVSGSTAYVASRDDGSLTIIDVSNPASPVLLKEIVAGVGGFDQLSGAHSVYVAGTTAFVASIFGHSLTVIDVTDPANPVLLKEIVDGVGGFDQLNGATSVYVDGTTAYVASQVDDSLTLIDVSDPATPVLLKEIVDGVGGFNRLDGARSAHVAGTVAYVTSFNDDSLTLIDVSDPAVPVLLKEIVDGVGGFNRLDGATSVHVAGTVAFVTSFNDDSLTLIDVSDPAAPVLLKEIVDGVAGFNGLDGPRSIHVAGSTAYVASIGDGSLTLIDVSDPTDPILLAEVVDGAGGFNLLDGANSIHVAGTTAYVASRFDNALTIIDVAAQSKVDLATSNRVGIGTSTPDAMLHVEGDAFVSGNLFDSGQQAGAAGQVLTATGTGTQWTALLDNNPANELQTLSLAGDTLSISGGNGADLGQYFLQDGSEPFGGTLDLGSNDIVNASALTVTGNLTADAHKFPAPRTFIHSISASRFVPDTPSEGYNRGSGLISPSGDTSLQFHAPVHLPDGATVTKVTGVFFDSGNPERFTDIDLRLRYYDNADLSEVIMAEFVNQATSAAFASGKITYDNTGAINAPVIDNANRTYSLDVTFSVAAPANSDTRFYGVWIEYTLDTLLP